MTYELARRLKNAGFPQTTPDGKWNLAPYLYSGNDGAHAPELSELIEACGDKFVSLEKSNKKWCAYVHSKKDERQWTTGYFLTPEKAVVESWFALNKK